MTDQGATRSTHRSRHDARPTPTAARTSRIAAVIVALIPLGFLALFFVFPVATLVWRGLGTGFAPVGEIFTKPSFRSVLWFTVWQAAASTVLTLIIAAPLTSVIARYRFAGRRAVRALVTVPFVLPTVVVSGAFIALIDRFGLDSGPVNLRHTTWAILAAHVFFNVAVVVRTVGGFWSQLDDRPEQAARVLGATPLRAFVEVTLPRLRRPIASAAVIIYLFTFTSFAIILLVGGPRKATLETEIYRYAVSRSDFTTGAALAVVQLIAVFGVVAISIGLRNGVEGVERLQTDTGRPLLGRAQIRAWFVIVATVGLLALPIIVLVEQSLSVGDGYALSHYSALSDDLALLPVSALDALVNSLAFGLVAAGIATIVGGVAAVMITHGSPGLRRILDLGVLLPIGTSAVTLGFGFLIALDVRPVDLRQSWWIIPIAQALIGLPFVVRSVVPVLRAIDEAMREAAATLGATPAQVRREIDLPLAMRALLVGMGFAFAVSLGEFGATSFVGRRPDLMTVPLAIARLLGQPGEQLRGQAMALSVVLMVVTAAVVMVLDQRDQQGLL